MSAPKTQNVHAELMRQMGTPRHEGFDPMPPRQHAAFLDRRESEDSRVIAWVWSKTIHPGKGNRRSHYARDHRADPLHQKHIAADLNMSPSNVSSAVKRLVDRGRIRIDDDGRICLRGDVPDPEIRLMGTDKQDNGEVILQNNSIRDFILYLQQHPETETRQRGVTALHAAARLAKRVKADAMAGARDIEEQIHSELFKTFGFVPSEPRAGRPAKSAGKRTVQLALTEQLSFLYENPDPDCVQNGNGSAVHLRNGAVHNDASLLVFSENQSTSSEGEVAAVREALSTYGEADDDAARNLIRACREYAEEAKADDIVDKIDKEAARAIADRRDVRNPIGLLLKIVPPKFKNWNPPPKPKAPEVDIEEYIATMEAFLREAPDHPQAEETRAELQKLYAQLDREPEAKGASA